MPTLDWLTREEDIKAASRVPYRLLKLIQTCRRATLPAGTC